MSTYQALVVAEITTDEKRLAARTEELRAWKTRRKVRSSLARASFFHSEAEEQAERLGHQSEYVREVNQPEIDRLIQHQAQASIKLRKALSEAIAGFYRGDYDQVLSSISMAESLQSYLENCISERSRLVRQVIAAKDEYSMSVVIREEVTRKCEQLKSTYLQARRRHLEMLAEYDQTCMNHEIALFELGAYGSTDITTSDRLAAA